MVSPRSGVVGGISIWTNNIMQFVSGQPDIELELCDFSRERSGQMIKNRLKRYILAIYDYMCLTINTIKQLRSFTGDVVHLSTSASYLLIRDYLLLLFVKSDVKTCIHFHFGRIPILAQKENWEWKLLKNIVRRSNVAIVMDRTSYDILRNEGFDNVELLPNPLSESVQDMIDKNILKREERVLLFAGHCIRTKGVYELIEACSQISNITLRMVGAVSDDMKAELMSLAGGNTGWLQILGQISHEETIRQMKLCDIFVLPTYTEGFPNVIIESMACGCPIVATTVGAIPEMLEEHDGNYFGQLIEPRNSKQIQMAIEKFLLNSKFKEDCGANARKRVKERYGISSVGNMLKKIWER